jgi:mono/diheme cytochrome c family protein
VVYRGDKLSQIYGDYVFADYGSGNIWVLNYDGTQATDWRRLTSGNGIVAFGTDPSNRDILFAEISTGRIQRIVYNNVPTGTPPPPNLADTGAFADLVSLTPQAGIVPYEVNAPSWSDGASQTHWFSVPDTNQFITFNPDAPWLFPTGTVWIRHFDLEITNGIPESTRRLETQFLVRNDEGVHGFTYRWNEDQSNAALVAEEGFDEMIQTYEGDTIHTQTWRYPSRGECLACHTPATGYALGFDTFQLNREHDFGTMTTNQILGLSQMGYFDEPVEHVSTLLRHFDLTDSSATTQDRIRSFLAVNCVQCHQPSATARGLWDARLTTPLAEAGILDGPLVDLQGDPNQRVVSPGSIETSMLLTRISHLGPGHMPPLVTDKLNQIAIDVLTSWITNQIAPELRQARFDLPGTISLEFNGMPNQSYRAEFSPDLTAWSLLMETSTDANGIGQAEDTEAGNDPGAHRFYRILQP